MSCITAHLTQLKKLTYGKHIVARIEKLLAAGNAAANQQVHTLQHTSQSMHLCIFSCRFRSSSWHLLSLTVSSDADALASCLGQCTCVPQHTLPMFIVDSGISMQGGQCTRFKNNLAFVSTCIMTSKQPETFCCIACPYDVMQLARLKQLSQAHTQLRTGRTADVPGSSTTIQRSQCSTECIIC